MDPTIQERDRVSWRPEYGQRQFGTVLKRDHLRNGTNKYLVRGDDHEVHYLSAITKEW